MHCWPKAPEHVAFLRTLHRHKFGVKVAVQVVDSDREVEFFTLQNDLNKVIVKQLNPRLQLDSHMSCEMLAEKLYGYLSDLDYTVREVTVDEDGENGATLVYA